MAPPIVSFKDTLAGFMGWIDPHFFGAKGDLVGYADCATDATGTWVSTPSAHVFTDTDVGKLFYADTGGNPFQIIAVDKVANKIQVNKAMGANLTNRFCFWGTDDTAALRAALLAARLSIGGGINGGAGSFSKNLNYGKAVRLRSGSAYLVRNTAADFAAGKVAALQIPRRTALVGGGVGPRQSRICVAPDSYGHGVSNETTLAYDDFNTIANLTIQGFKGLGAANVLDGLHLEIAFNNYSETDAFTNAFDVDITGFTRDGFYANGRGEGVFRNIRSLGNGRYGFYPNRTMDSKFIECNAGGNSKTGFRIDAVSSAMFIGCKSFYNGSGGGTSYTDCANWHIWSDDGKNSGAIFSACESQESRGSGWVFDGAGMIILNACTSGLFGRETQGSGTRPDICAGYHFKQGLVSPRAITVSNCRADGGTYFAGNNWGYGTNAVHLDAGTQEVHGNFEIGPYCSYDQSLNVAPLTYGPVGGPGATNGLNTRLRVNGVALT